MFQIKIIKRPAKGYLENDKRGPSSSGYLKIDATLITENQQVANISPKNLQLNYSQNLHKTPFSSENKEYNLPFSLTELKLSLQHPTIRSLDWIKIIINSQQIQLIRRY